jgi:hypothetical protein
LPQDAIHVAKKIRQQLVRILKFIGHSLVCSPTVLVIVCHDAPLVPRLAWRADGMRIVIAQYPLTVRVMQGKRVTNAVRDGTTRQSAPRFDLDPVPASLVNDLAVEIKDYVDSRVADQTLTYQLMISLDFYKTRPRVSD